MKNIQSKTTALGQSSLVLLWPGMPRMALPHAHLNVPWNWHLEHATMGEVVEDKCN
jgi:hypothetical protein